MFKTGGSDIVKLETGEITHVLDKVSVPETGKTKVVTGVLCRGASKRSQGPLSRHANRTAVDKEKQK